MRATEKDRKRLENEISHLVMQLKKMGAVKIILFGSLAQGEISLFTDIDMLVLFKSELNFRDLTRWVYRNIHCKEALDLLAYDQQSFEKICSRSFFQHILKEGKVLYERLEA